MLHYQDYVKMNVSPSSVVLNKIEEADKDLITQVRKQHIKNNLVLLIVLGIGFVGVLCLFIWSLAFRSSSLFADVFTIALALAALIAISYYGFDVLGPFKGVRRGVVLTADRIGEAKDNRNRTYQYVFDIYLEDSEQTLMSYQVSKEVFQAVNPGDGVVLFKTLKKLKALPDPTRKSVMDVSKIKSGI